LHFIGKRAKSKLVTETIIHQLTRQSRESGNPIENEKWQLFSKIKMDYRFRAC
jgi:hypothetical protein